MSDIPRLENYETLSDGPSKTPTLRPLVGVARTMVDSLTRAIDNKFGLGPLGKLPGDDAIAEEGFETTEALKSQMRKMSPESEKPRI